jgi:predicted nucleic acid-binding protein
MLIDSNMIIYAAQPAHAKLRTFIATYAPVVSAVSYVEVLGYHALSPNQASILRRFFETAVMLPIDTSVLDQAVRLRQQKKMSLGDALIAATALVHRLPLVTHNVADFVWIRELTVLDPLADV